ncbi:MAG: type II/IV secretion system ATPase subunit [Desulfurococcales archaeon]|nr:type II/IV secretion system ATPase subunit [Desulfurococcales archaeon]
MKNSLLKLFSQEKQGDTGKEETVEETRGYCEETVPVYRYEKTNIEFLIVRSESSFMYCVHEPGSEEYLEERRKSGYGQLYPIIQDDNIEEISVNGPSRPVFVLNKLLPGIWLESNIMLDGKEADSIAYNLAVRARRAVSLLTPIAEGLTNEGYRVSVTYSREVSRWGSSFVIRKYPSNPPSIVQLIEQNVISSLMAAYLWFVIDHKKFILITGGMGAGKTTFLNALIEMISPYSRVLTLEDTPEIRVVNKNWDSLITRPVYPGSEYAEISLFDLVKFSLRRRADYLIIGEVRGKEAQGLAQAVATGQGSIATFHADSPSNALERLKMEPINLSPAFISLVSVIVHLKKSMKRGVVVSRRAEVVMEQSGGELIPVFKWDPRLDYFSPENIEELLHSSRVIEAIADREGYSVSEILGNMLSRARLLEMNTGASRSRFREEVEKFYMSRLSEREA